MWNEGMLTLNLGLEDRDWTLREAVPTAWSLTLRMWKVVRLTSMSLGLAVPPHGSAAT